MIPRVVTLCLALALSGPAVAGSQLAAECPLAEARPETTALILWVGAARMTSQGQGAHVLGPVRALARLRRGKLEPTDGENLREGMRVWNVLDRSDSALGLSSVSSLLDRAGEDHCVYAAEVRPGQPRGTLLATAPLPGVFRAPSAEDRAFFQSHDSGCVDQGDFEPADKPPCTRGELLAVSDVDANGELEYWATQPTTWDTGISVWRRTSMGLEAVLEACPGCSE
jgi:hypothetical protein